MTKESTLQPFKPGDIFAGATVLNNPDDDHAGDGRIIQYDSKLNEKGVLWTKGTTHLVGGLKFGPDGTLWAFDSQGFNVIRVSPEGHALPKTEFPKRSFSNVNFAPDGNVYLGEHLVGAEVKLPPDRPLGTKLPFLPGEKRFGDGHVFKCSTDGKLIKEFKTESHGGMPGFLGVTSSTLAPDGKTLVYCSELGNRLFRYDLEADKQLPDLITYDPASGDMTMIAGYQPDGTLMYIKANFRAGFFLQKLDPDSGEVLQTWNTEGPGWASLGVSTEPGKALVGNFFTGSLIKLDLASGETIARAETDVKRSLAGIAQYSG
jgi:outer membrane protein assembly factor BamB